jgi:nucleotide-binding universal stress UspA family protein
LDTAARNPAFDVVHQARCSVRVVTRGAVPHHGPIRLLLGNDGSAGALSAMKMIERRTWPPGTELRLLAVGTHSRARPVETLQAGGIEVSEMHVEGDPCQVLVQEAERWNPDAVFLGARGATAIRSFLLGSVSTAVVTRLRHTVEVVR